MGKLRGLKIPKKNFPIVGEPQRLGVGWLITRGLLPWQRGLDTPLAGTKDVDGGSRMKRAMKRKKIEHLYKAIVTMRSEQGHNSAKEQVQRVVEILKCDYGVSVPDSLRNTIGRRIREFNAGQKS